MGRKITAFRIDTRGETVTVRALSKSLRGTGFTLAGTKVEKAGKGKGPVKQAIRQAIEELLREPV